MGHAQVFLKYAHLSTDFDTRMIQMNGFGGRPAGGYDGNKVTRKTLYQALKWEECFSTHDILVNDWENVVTPVRNKWFISLFCAVVEPPLLRSYVLCSVIGHDARVYHTLY